MFMGAFQHEDRTRVDKQMCQKILKRKNKEKKMYSIQVYLDICLMKIYDSQTCHTFPERKNKENIMTEP